MSSDQKAVFDSTAAVNTAANVRRKPHKSIPEGSILERRRLNKHVHPEGADVLLYGKNELPLHVVTVRKK